MTPEERNLVTELFDRLATLEDAPRDGEAERLIQDGLRQAPNATYALVQTVLIQDEALKRADARIRQLEAQSGATTEPPRPAGFLDSMRDNLWGRRDTPRSGSVPTVRPGGAPTDASAPPMGSPSMGSPPPGAQPTGAQPMGAPYGGQPYSGGGSGAGSFLSMAAATAVGVVGSSLLLGSIRSMMGSGSGSGSGTSHGALNPPSGGSASPWGGGSDNSGGIGSGRSGGSDLANQAGLGDVGRGGGSRDDAGASRSYGLTDSDTSKAAGERDEPRHAGDDNQGRSASEGQDDHPAGGGRYSAENDEENIGEMDEGDLGGDFDSDEQ